MGVTRAKDFIQNAEMEIQYYTSLRNLQEPFLKQRFIIFIRDYVNS
jgi:hypothetical protein